MTSRPSRPSGGDEADEVTDDKPKPSRPSGDDETDGLADDKPESSRPSGGNETDDVADDKPMPSRPSGGDEADDVTDDKPKPSRPSGGDEADVETWDGVDKPKPSRPSGDDETDGTHGTQDCTAIEEHLVKRLSLFTDICGVQESDVTMDGAGKVLDTTRICTEKCHKQSLLKADVPKLPESLEHCGQLEEQLRLAERLVTLMHDALQNCNDQVHIKKNTTGATDNDFCPDATMAHRDCGYMGIDKAQCEEKGCCWNANAKGKLPWCYHSKGSSDRSEVERCYNQNGQSKAHCPANFDKHRRSDCVPFLMLDKELVKHRDDNVRGRACESVGCCWQPLTHNSKEPWCFHKLCM
eukprot:TRINITY_DN2516_c0_g1_i4.p1 TRINITY_DN2516_c0_g1~~TRINITY_DN2516_c0_g1_i4.p1  ORF type:complete len:353 (-),score=77.47 TRINITY_DN2516_c0_g1_i4:644-1702(-)